MKRLARGDGGSTVEEGELRELIGHQEKIREDERKRIAREIHDELGQRLLALRIEVSLLKQDEYDFADKRSQRIDEILEHVDATVGKVNGCAALLCFLVKRCPFVDEEGNIGNVCGREE